MDIEAQFLLKKSQAPVEMYNKKLPDLSFLDEQIQRLAAFVDNCHGTQVRKYTGLRYVHHLAAVAQIVQEYTADPRLLAIALSHDLYEDTPCTVSAFKVALQESGFAKADSVFIHEMVSELTDEYIKANYPDWNRKKRKKAEAERLWKVSAEAQTVKYADIIDNSLDFLKNDRQFARRYLAEAELILQGMDKGDARLYKEAVRTVKHCKEQL